MTDFDISTDEMRVAFSGPAFAANRFFVTIGPAGVRIAFTEQWKDDVTPEFRCAAIVPISDAIQLKDLLTRVLSSLETQIVNATMSKGGTSGI